jgi:1-phosphofructokinase family hexose kinase
MAVSPILVLALNPSIDAEWSVDAIRWEEKNAVQNERRWAGGKGINVARWLKHLGGDPRLLLPLGGDNGHELSGFLRSEKLRARIIPLTGSTRVNVIVTTRSGRQMRFNPAGPVVPPAVWKRVANTVSKMLSQSCIGSPCVLSGSLPRGLPATAYSQLIRLARRSGALALVDCDGAALAAATKSGPFLVKPNAHELSLWCGTPLRSETQIVQAARQLSQITRGWVLVSRGAKRSFLLNVTLGKYFTAHPPRATVLNTVGAGDAMLAAVALEIQRNSPPERWLERGLATGTAATTLPAGHLPVPGSGQ